VKWLLIIVAGLLGLFVVVSFFLPQDYYVERSIDISVPAALVYSQVVDLEAWLKWDPWGEMDPETKVTFGSIKVGTGASYSWESETSGNGSMAIIETNPPEMARFELIFEGYEDNPSYSSMLIDSTDSLGPCSVTWTFEGSVGDKLFARWMAVMMDKFVGMNYEKGLNNLKELCESMGGEVPVMETPDS